MLLKPALYVRLALYVSLTDPIGHNNRDCAPLIDTRGNLGHFPFLPMLFVWPLGPAGKIDVIVFFCMGLLEVVIGGVVQLNISIGSLS